MIFVFLDFLRGTMIKQPWQKILNQVQDDASFANLVMMILRLSAENREFF